MSVALAVNSTTDERFKTANALASWSSSPDLQAFFQTLDLAVISTESSMVQLPSPGLTLSSISILLNPVNGSSSGSSGLVNGSVVDMLTGGSGDTTAADNDTNDSSVQVVSERILVMGSGMIAGVVCATVVPVVALAAFAWFMRHRSCHPGGSKGDLFMSGGGAGAAGVGKGGAGQKQGVRTTVHIYDMGPGSTTSSDDVRSHRVRDRNCGKAWMPCVRDTGFRPACKLQGRDGPAP